MVGPFLLSKRAVHDRALSLCSACNIANAGERAEKKTIKKKEGIPVFDEQKENKRASKRSSFLPPRSLKSVMTRRKQELLFPFTKLLVMSNKYVMASRGYIMIYQVAAAAAAAGIVFYVCWSQSDKSSQVLLSHPSTAYRTVFDTPMPSVSQFGGMALFRDVGLSKFGSCLKRTGNRVTPSNWGRGSIFVLHTIQTVGLAACYYAHRLQFSAPLHTWWDAGRVVEFC
ncbi:unnamed protein product [Fusarium graminearum]|uniref:Chromosome 2, complete genome n=2 Tax=Gibberella zeae TaxID=5518 RepID=I1S5Y3_GIBZE|nr:hypothetical protein FGSG_12254 [Fusarium graminearum PH-1]EYB25012.1 hypothetical protein FG05_12254 [Fusarium graminearum]ESU08641.1 hypothetical protein FGSG_12254 [Fusarium graminearum PH-1]CAF3517500.1 unnamed protein product [Fusarium graminearum]CAG2006197.1 unnamed protein product [Fusarium graminearum]CEF79476.1 unnamed protein product [Fusarium graminearum]|eukprot:XP_011321140.1 hypothetical protein FGSG_12254 [Fusarium graminearum PH-1]